MSSNSSNNISIKIEALSRFTSLPLINSALNSAAVGYTGIKSYNGLISATLFRAEQSIDFMVSTAQPVIQKLERPISYADNIVCQGLDKLQEKVPDINKSPEELKDGTKKLLEDGVTRIGVVRKFSSDKIQAFKDYAYTKVNGVLDLPFPRLSCQSIDTAIDLTDKAVANELEAEEGQQTLVVRMSH